jgi:hypothetical protein
MSISSPLHEPFTKSHLLVPRFTGEQLQQGIEQCWELLPPRPIHAFLASYRGTVIFVVAVGCHCRAAMSDGLPVPKNNETHTLAVTVSHACFLRCSCCACWCISFSRYSRACHCLKVVSQALTAQILFSSNRRWKMCGFQMWAKTHFADFFLSQHSSVIHSIGCRQ